MRENHDDMAWKQQYRILKSKQVENPNPKKQWDKDIVKFLHSLPKDDEKILMIDTNNNLDNRMFGEFVANSGLYNLMSSRYRDNLPLTYIRGKNVLTT